MDSRVARISEQQYRSMMRPDHDQDNMLCVINEADASEWYALVCGMDDPYVGGEFLFKAKLGEDFPMKPPTIGSLTPNGMFVPDGHSICLSIGQFHSNVDRSTHGREYAVGWRPTLGVHGFLRATTFGVMVDWENRSRLSGIRIIDYDKHSREDVRKMSANSSSYNRKHYAEIMATFDRFVEEHPDRLAVKTLAASRAQL